uniref:DUF834 domain-containing protein n=1 Tax=Oryza glumipatula TaxID=40148 RepID=A0A0D9Y3Q3_9ORYZ
MSNAFRLDRRRELPPSPNLPSNNDGAEQHDAPAFLGRIGAAPSPSTVRGVSGGELGASMAAALSSSSSKQRVGEGARAAAAGSRAGAGAAGGGRSGGGGWEGGRRFGRKGKRER